MVSIEEIDYIPEFISEVRQEVGTAARRDIVQLAADLHADLLIIGAAGHSGMHQRVIGASRS
jgi:nucleotide-binding universal stress UspA family protein